MDPVVLLLLGGLLALALTLLRKHVARSDGDADDIALAVMEDIADTIAHGGGTAKSVRADISSRLRKRSA